MKIIGVIPARYASSRFPAKPLALIAGKPMFYWVYQQAMRVFEFSDVFIATDHEDIANAAKKYNCQVIMTKDSHPTGTDRVAEVAQKIPADIYINIQGDEPLIEPETIRQAILPLIEHKDIEITNLMACITDPVEVINSTIPKVLTNAEGRGIYLSRCPVPYPKNNIEYTFYKQVCVYGFRPNALDFFAKTERGRLESIEDIEILRFIENNKAVHYIEVQTQSIAVDTNKDLEKVRKIFAHD